MTDDFIKPFLEVPPGKLAVTWWSETPPNIEVHQVNTHQHPILLQKLTFHDLNTVTLPSMSTSSPQAEEIRLKLKCTKVFMSCQIPLFQLARGAV